MAEYKTGVQVNYGFGLSFEASGKAPVIAKRIWETLADAQAYVDSATDTAIAGLQLTVINDTDASKNGVYFVKEAAGENGKTVGVLVKLAQNADTSDLQTQVTANKQAIDKLNGDEGAAGSVKNTAKSYADKALAAVPVKGVKTGDNVISLGTDGKLSSTIAFSIDAIADSSGKRYLKLTGIGGANLGKVDIADFVKDGMLEGSALYKATAATGTITINGKSYSLTGLTANHTYIVLVWNTDSSKDAMPIDVTTLIDVYTAGEGLTLTGNQFSVDKTKVAQKADLDKLETALVNGGVSINGYDILTKNEDTGEITGSTLILDAEVVKLTGSYAKATESKQVKGNDAIQTAIGKLEYKADKAITDAAAAAAKAGVTSVGGQKGDIVLDNEGAGSYPIKLTMDGKKIKASVFGLGSAAAHLETDFATQAQGVKADNSVQLEPIDNAGDQVINTGSIHLAGIEADETHPKTIEPKLTLLGQNADTTTITPDRITLGSDGASIDYGVVLRNDKGGGTTPVLKVEYEDGSCFIRAKVGHPTEADDATTKDYVDSKVGAVDTGVISISGTKGNITLDSAKTYGNIALSIANNPTTGENYIAANFSWAEI